MQIYQLMPTDGRRGEDKTGPILEPREDAPGLSIRFTARRWFEEPHCLDYYVNWCHERDLPYVLHPLAGRHYDPAWGIRGRQLIHCAARTNQIATKVPIPWKQRYQSWLEFWLEDVAEYVGDDPFCVGWHVCGIFRDSSEIHVPPEVKAIGSDEQIVEAVKAVAIAQLCCQPRGWDLILNCAGSGRRKFAAEIVAMSYEMGLGIQHNALKASTALGSQHHKFVSQFQGPRGFQAARPRPDVMGDLDTAFDIADQAGAEWLELYDNQIEAANRRYSG